MVGLMGQVSFCRALWGSAEGVSRLVITDASVLAGQLQGRSWFPVLHEQSQRLDLVGCSMPTVLLRAAGVPHQVRGVLLVCGIWLRHMNIFATLIISPKPAMPPPLLIPGRLEPAPKSRAPPLE